MVSRDNVELKEELQEEANDVGGKAEVIGEQAESFADGNRCNLALDALLDYLKLLGQVEALCDTKGRRRAEIDECETEAGISGPQSTIPIAEVKNEFLKQCVPDERQMESGPALERYYK